MQTPRSLLGVIVLTSGLAVAVAAQTQAPEKDAPRPNARSPLGVNLAALTDGPREIPFTNIFSLATPWVARNAAKPDGKTAPLELNADGWVRRLDKDQVAEATLFSETFRIRGGVYTCIYDGEGDLEFVGNLKVDSRKDRRMTLLIAPGPGPIIVRLNNTDPADPLRHIRLYAPGWDTAPGFDKKAPIALFEPKFLERWNKFKVLRFAGWQRTNNSKLEEWAERARPTSATQAGPAGVCPEHMIELANAVGANPWFCMPHHASDDFVRQFARLVKDKLHPELKVYVEYSQECWNGQYQQTKHCRDQGKERRLSDNLFEAQLRFYADRSVEIFDIWHKEFDPKRVVRVLAGQRINPWTGTTIAYWREAYKKADALAVSTHFGSELGDPRTAEKLVFQTPEGILESCRNSIYKTANATRSYVALAQACGLDLLAYEGGERLGGFRGAENRDLEDLFRKASRHPRMKDVHLEDLDVWKSLGGGMFCVSSADALNISYDDPSQAPRFQAAFEFIAKNRK